MTCSPHSYRAEVIAALRMAMDSREFYELSQNYRHSQEWWAHDEGKNYVIVAWDALKQYILDNVPECNATSERK